MICLRAPKKRKSWKHWRLALELVKDYGIFTIISKPLYWLLNQLHSVLQNWGWSIVALVLLLKIAFYWLNAKAYASMAKMKAVNPKITEMRERLKDNPQQMQQEMMRIYREEKVNPMGGCFPIMIQIPVFIALYWVLLSSVEMRNAPWMLWIHDLSSPDPYFILPLVMTMTTMLQTALNPAPPDPLQAKMMWFMPLAFSVMFFFFPAGLVLYWITNNVLSIAQQWVINTRMGVPPQFNSAQVQVSKARDRDGSRTPIRSDHCDSHGPRPWRGGHCSRQRAQSYPFLFVHSWVVSLRPREATYLPFADATGQPLDQGLALFFPGPHSFTGEDVLELQAHGGVVVLQLLAGTVLGSCLPSRQRAQWGALAGPACCRARRVHPASLSE